MGPNYNYWFWPDPGCSTSILGTVLVFGRRFPLDPSIGYLVDRSVASPQLPASLIKTSYLEFFLPKKTLQPPPLPASQQPLPYTLTPSLCPSLGPLWPNFEVSAQSTHTRLLPLWSPGHTRVVTLPNLSHTCLNPAINQIDPANPTEFN